MIPPQAGNRKTAGKKLKGHCAPFGAHHDFVQIAPAFFTKILVRAGSFVHDADTAAVLPDLANVALDEQATCFIALDVRVCHSGQLAFFGLAGIRRWTRVFLLATQATCDLILFCNIVFELIVGLSRIVVVVVVLLARPATGLGRIHLRSARMLVDVLGREGEASFLTNDNWVERFTSLAQRGTTASVWGLNFGDREPSMDQIAFVKRALSFAATPQGICSYDMLEAVGWWTPLSPAPLPVIHIANMIVGQLGLPADISMSEMMSYGCVFLCSRCENTIVMNWISLVSRKR